jgi:alpha-L-fucosidase
MTLGDQWAWKPDDKIKSLKQCLQTLVSVVGGDGNLLFNVGPMPDGRIEPCQVERLREMGAWLKEFGESIYGTRGGPFPPAAWGVSTHKDNKIYLHLFDCSTETVVLPVLSDKILSATLLGGTKVDFVQNQDGIRVNLPKVDPQRIDTVVVMERAGANSP